MFDPLMVWSDEEGTDVEVVKLLSWDRSIVPVNTYLQIEDNNLNIIWICCVSEPNRNITLTGLDRKDPRVAETLKRISQGTLQDGFLTKTARLYVARPIGMIVDGVSQPVTMRPIDGLKAYKADESNVIPALMLPKAKTMNVIGSVSGTDIRVALNKRAIDHNMIIAGTIGSGKTEATGRIIAATAEMGYCTFVFDHKPDYQDLTTPNNIGEDPRGLDQAIVQYWTLNRDVEHYEKPVSVPASELDIEFWMNHSFPNPEDDKQRDTFVKLIKFFRDEVKPGEIWTFEELSQWFNEEVMRNAGKGKEITDYGKRIFDGSPPHSTTLATFYKISIRKPDWVDRVSVGKGFLGTKQTFTSFLHDPSVFRDGIVNVVKVSNVGSREYALFAVSLLKRQLSGRADGSITPWIANFIDEAQDIFNGDRSLRSIGIPAFAEITRKGRSKHVGSVFCVQAFTEIPDDIVQYCNTRIIMRHGSRDIAKQALDGDTFSAMQTTSFSPGDAFVRIYGCPTYVKAKMLPSPFFITKEQNPEDYAE